MQPGMAELRGGPGMAPGSAELEVRKLQELVRRLERQNEQLRRNCSGGSPQPSPHSLHRPPPAGLCVMPSPVPTLLCTAGGGLFYQPEPYAFFQQQLSAAGAQPAAAAAAGAGGAQPASLAAPTGPSLLDQVEPLDLEDTDCCGEEDTW